MERLGSCKRPSFLRKQTGVSLVIALLALLILTIIGISAMTTALFETGIAGNERIYNDAFYMADAGIDFFFATCTVYVHSDAAEGSIDSRELPLEFGGRYFLLHWERIREETGPPKKAEFKVISEGNSPSVPTAGKVNIEAAIEAVDQEAWPKVRLRSWREIF